MQPLSKNKRRVYLVGFVVLFFLCVPVVLLFANGFRFEGGAGFVKTGGIYISVPYADAVVSMNGEEVGTSGLLKRGFYIDDLTPGSYVIGVTRGVPARGTGRGGGANARLRRAGAPHPRRDRGDTARVRYEHGLVHAGHPARKLQ